MKDGISSADVISLFNRASVKPTSRNLDFLLSCSTDQRLIPFLGAETLSSINIAHILATKRFLPDKSSIIAVERRFGSSGK